MGSFKRAIWHSMRSTQKGIRTAYRLFILIACGFEPSFRNCPAIKIGLCRHSRPSAILHLPKLSLVFVTVFDARHFNDIIQRAAMRLLMRCRDHFVYHLVDSVFLADLKFDILPEFTSIHRSRHTGS